MIVLHVNALRIPKDREFHHRQMTICSSAHSCQCPVLIVAPPRATEINLQHESQR
jgi:hypothetical protein